MSPADAKSKLEAKFPGIQIQIINNALLMKPEDLIRVVQFLKDSPEFKMNYLSNITAVDYVEYLESVYHLYSIENPPHSTAGPIVLKVRVPRDNPKIPSLVPVFRGAEFQEREAYDMMGIVYEGHPDLRRIFMWEGFEGFPLRKDYTPEDADVLEWEDVEWLEKHGVKVPEEYKQFARQLKDAGKEARAQKPTEKEI
ncbi:MAG: NADH-quinone oxidoreductase subunit C [Candidatus Omnitrophica bacterium]|nr:NADH-quinone oxidoreductase subunit C [Candidatus Omnitrophota bacterium]